MRGVDAVATLDPLIARVASEGLLPQVDLEPRLVVFGFDRDQREGALTQLIARLTDSHGLTVYAVGNPSAKVNGAFRPRSMPGT